MSDVIAGRFELCDPIAQGGSGVVWRAFDRRRGEYCALKVLRRRDAGMLLRFVREQSVRLSHAYVLTPYSWAAEDDQVAIASELLDGGSLATLIGDYGPLAEPTVAAILAQLLEALEFVHGAGLVHRDVKPANVLLHATGTGPLHARLADFGLAVSSADARLTQHGTVVGTASYLAPEAREGAPPHPRQDLFAAGQVALALLAGSEADGPRSAPAAGTGSALSTLLAALVDPDPGRRPPSATRARELLSPMAGGTAPRARDGEPVDVLHQLPAADDGAGTDVVAGAAPPATATGRLTVAAPEAPPRRGRRLRLGVAGAAVAVSAAFVALLAVLFTSGAPGADPGGGRGATPGATGSATAGVDAPRRTPSGASGAPTSTTAAGQVRAGAPCSWQQQGDMRSTADGTQVVCTLRDGDYTWVAGG